MNYLNRHIDGSEKMLRGRMKKSYDKVLMQCKTSAESAYTKWLVNKMFTYYPGNTWIDEPTATAWALRNIPDFEFLIQLIVAAHFQAWFGQWISTNKHVDGKKNTVDFEFE